MEANGQTTPSSWGTRSVLLCEDLADRLADLKQQVDFLEDFLANPDVPLTLRPGILRQIAETRETMAAVENQLAACHEGMAIVGIEQTQAIQYFLINDQGSGFAPDNSLPLIAQRALALRVYVDSTRTLAPTTPGIPPAGPQIPVYISGRVAVDRFLGSGAVERIAVLRPVNVAIVARPGPTIDRGNPNHTLNFRVPAADCQGVLRFSVTVFEQGPVVVGRATSAIRRTPAAAGTALGTAGTGIVDEAVGVAGPSASTQVYARFEPVPAFRIQPVLVHYTGGGQDLPAPTPLDFVASLDLLLRTYPIGRLEFGDCLPLELDESLSYGAAGCGPGWEGTEPGHEGILTRLMNMDAGSDDRVIYVALIPSAVPSPCSAGRGNTWVAAALAGMPGVMAQEVGHALRLKHAPGCDAPGAYPLCGPGVDSLCYPNYGNDKYPPGSIGEFGFDVSTSTVYDPSTYFDFMTYCGSRWISPFTYMRLRAGMVERFGDPSSARSARATPRETLFLNFRVHRDGSVEVRPSFHLPTAIDPIELGWPSDVSCELLSKDDEVLEFHPCRQTDPHQHPDGPYLDFREAIPWVTRASSIRFLRKGEVLHTHKIEEVPPEVELRTPQVEYSDGRTRLEWTGRHPERELTYMLRYSHDGGKTWRALAANLRHATWAVSPSRLPGGDHCLFQVVASSGIRTSVAKSEPFTAPQKPRKASILSPEPRTEKPQGTPVVLRGGAYSPDFGLGELEDAVWSSNVSGLLGRGFELVAEDLSTGVHTITLTVPDGLEGTATAHVSVRITPRADE